LEKGKGGLDIRVVMECNELTQKVRMVVDSSWAGSGHSFKFTYLSVLKVEDPGGNGKKRRVSISCGPASGEDAAPNNSKHTSEGRLWSLTQYEELASRGGFSQTRVVSCVMLEGSDKFDGTHIGKLLSSVFDTR